MFSNSQLATVPSTDSLTRAVPLAAEDLLWHRVGEGESSALIELYREHNVAVRAFAARLLGDEDAAEDLVQDVFLNVPRAARRTAPQASTRSYLLGMAANCARKHIRTAVRRRAAVQRLGRESLAPETRTPDQDVDAGRLVERLMCALDKLPDKLRVAFVLCQIEERDATEVSLILDLPPSTVRARLSAARERLQGAPVLGKREEVR